MYNCIFPEIMCSCIIENHKAYTKCTQTLTFSQNKLRVQSTICNWVISIAFCTSVWIFAVFFPNLHCNRPLLKSLQTKLFVSLRLWKLSVDPRLTVCEVCAIGGELGLSFDIAKTDIARGRGWYAHPQLHVDNPPRRAQRRGFPKSMLLIIIYQAQGVTPRGSHTNCIHILKKLQTLARKLFKH